MGSVSLEIWGSLSLEQSVKSVPCRSYGGGGSRDDLECNLLNGIHALLMPAKRVGCEQNGHEMAVLAGCQTEHVGKNNIDSFSTQ